MLLNILFCILGIILGYLLFTFISLRNIAKLNKSFTKELDFTVFLDNLNKLDK